MEPTVRVRSSWAGGSSQGARSTGAGRRDLRALLVVGRTGRQSPEVAYGGGSSNGGRRIAPLVLSRFSRERFRFRIVLLRQPQPGTVCERYPSSFGALLLLRPCDSGAV